MFGSEILEVAIGLILVYLMLALLCSAIGEYIARMLALRSVTLETGIRNLLEDPGGTRLSKKVYDHALIKALSKKGWFRKARPSNIPSRTFTLALFDTVMAAGHPIPPPPSGPEASDKDEEGKSRALQHHARATFEALEDRVRLLGAPPEVKKALQSILATAKSEANQWDQALAKARTSVETWFDDSMDRVSGWYKRKMQLIIIVLGIGLSFALNVDTFVIANTLARDTTLRESVVAAAEERAKQQAPEAQPGSPANGADEQLNISELREELDQLGLPIGWSFSTESDDPGTNDPRDYPNDVPGWIVKVAGILFTGFAVSFGAPFWFDTLNKFINLRGSGARPQKSSETVPARPPSG